MGIDDAYTRGLRYYAEGIKSTDDLHDVIFCLNRLFWLGNETFEIGSCGADDAMRYEQIMLCFRLSSKSLGLSDREWDTLDAMARLKVSWRKQPSSRKRRRPKQPGTRQRRVKDDDRVLSVLAQYVRNHNEIPSARKLSMLARCNWTKAKQILMLPEVQKR